MDDLERQIVAWVDAETEGIDPVTPEDVWDRTGPAPAPAPGSVTPPRRRAALVAAAILLVALGLAAAQLVTRRGHDQPAGPVAAEDWRRLVEPDRGWTLRHPVSWAAERWDTPCHSYASTIVTNQPEPPERIAQDGANCGRIWNPSDLDRPGFVGIEILHTAFRGGPLRSTAPLVDTRLPLRLEDLPVNAPDDPWTDVEGQTVIHDGDAGTFVQVWIAPDANPDDVRALGEVVASFAWAGTDGETPEGEATAQGGDAAPATGSSRMTTFIACMADAGFHPYLADPPFGMIDGEVGARLTWPAGEQDRTGYDASYDTCNGAASASQRRRSGSTLVWPVRAGPSQTPAEAERDGVVPELATYPLADRAVPTRWFDTPEGTWAITTMPERPGGTDCTVGDAEGAYGTEYICSAEYGEVLLVDEQGAVLRSYPMPGEIPTWILPTKDAIYAGRVGDGSLPESTIARIDRHTLEAEVLVFPPANGILAVDLDGWSVAPAGADISKLVVVGNDSAGPLVNSTIGITSVDLAAIEELFA